jgi:hypothetical protein
MMFYILDKMFIMKWSTTQREFGHAFKTVHGLILLQNCPQNTNIKHKAEGKAFAFKDPRTKGFCMSALNVSRKNDRKS